MIYFPLYHRRCTSISQTSYVWSLDESLSTGYIATRSLHARYPCRRELSLGVVEYLWYCVVLGYHRPHLRTDGVSEARKIIQVFVWYFCLQKYPKQFRGQKLAFLFSNIFSVFMTLKQFVP